MNTLKFKTPEGKIVRLKANKGKWSNDPRRLYAFAIMKGWTHKRLQYRNPVIQR